MKSKIYRSVFLFAFAISTLPKSTSAQIIAGGNYYTLAICNDSTVKTWGSNVSGQLGNGSTSDSNIPVQVSNLSGVIAIVGEGNHSLALKSDSTVWCWGLNTWGQLGTANNTSSNIPLLVNTISDVIAIGGGTNHSLALKNNGSVWAWGQNLKGQLGDGSNTDSNVPVQVSGLSGIIAVAGGAHHSIALKNDGTVWTWGFNDSGRLGNGTNVDSNIPVQVSGLSGIIAIAGTGAGTIVLKNDGTVWSCGTNLNGQLGDGTLVPDSYTPVQVSGLSGITAIAGGFSHSLALKNTGTVWAWGDNGAGQLGNGTIQNDTNNAIQVTGLSGVAAIAGGGTHSIAFKNDGTFFVWGYGNNGQIGNGTNTNENPLPVQITGLCAPLTTTINDITEESFISVYPNPAHDRIVIEHDLTNQINEIKLFDITGKNVKIITENLSAKKINVNVSDLAKGLYFLHFNTSNGNTVQKIVID